MGLMCLIGSHKWDGCKCSVCGKKRDKGHDWTKDCGKCARCAAERNDSHKWADCKCSACGKARDEGHDWSKDCGKCARCGVNRNKEHPWSGCKCPACGKTRDEEHKWKKCKCVLCGKDLISVLQKGDWEAQIRAVEALARTCDPAAITPLLDFWDDLDRMSNTSYRRLKAVEDAFTTMGEMAVPPLLLILQDTSAWQERRQAAVKMLTLIRDPRAIDALITCLRDEDGYLRGDAASALGSFHDPRAVEPLLQCIDTGVSQWEQKESGHNTDEDTYHAVTECMRALGQLGDVRAVGPLRALLASPWFGDDAACALGGLPDPCAEEPLLTRLRSDNTLTRLAAFEALARRGNPRFVEPLINAARELWHDFSGDREGFYRRRVVDGLGAMRNPQVLKLLFLALEDRDDSVCADAVRNLGALGSPEAIKRVLAWIFSLRGSLEYLSEMSSELRLLFGDYTDLIIRSAAGYGERSDAGDPSVYVSIDYDLSECDAAIRELCQIQSSIASNILHKVSTKKDLDVIVGSSEHGDMYHNGTLSFEHQRRMARKELVRRGNPKYDVSAYSEKSAWNRR